MDQPDSPQTDAGGIDTQLEQLSDYQRGRGILADAETATDVAAIVLDHKSAGDIELRHAVYTLRCRNPFRDGKDAVRYAIDTKCVESTTQLDTIREAASYANLFYIGQSKDVTSRLLNHLSGSGLPFTATFRPYVVNSIRWFESESEARAFEYDHAEEVREHISDAYVGGGR